jgi:hypothetical protein
MHELLLTKRGTETKVGVGRPIGLVTCPNCRVEMPRVSLTDPEDAKALRAAIYRCPRCDAETRRWIVL